MIAGEKKDSDLKPHQSLATKYYCRSLLHYVTTIHYLCSVRQYFPLHHFKVLTIQA